MKNGEVMARERGAIKSKGYLPKVRNVLMYASLKHRLTRTMLALAFACFVTGCVTSGRREVLMFSATGDGPLGPSDWTLLPEYFAAEEADGRSEFLLHVGDITAQCGALPESHYVKVAELFKTSHIPVMIVPGDNEWNDLQDPDEGWTYWERHFLAFEQNFSNAPRVRRQPARPENVAWVSKGVLMIGINLVGGRIHDRDEWKRRHLQNAEWVLENMKRHIDAVRAAVIFAQAAPSGGHEDFFSMFVESAKSFEKPVLYIHGDGHVWNHEPGWRAPNILRVQVDAVPTAPPVQVTVTLDPDEPFRFDRRREKDRKDKKGN